MNDWLREWFPLWIPLSVVIITQFIKIVLEIPKNGFVLKNFNNYGGMPSSHTALCVSISTVIGLVEGFSSPLFALSLMVSIIFIRDAVGIRWELGYHGRMLNKLIHLLPKEDHHGFPKHLEERLGHTPIEALSGGIVGTLLTWILYIIVTNLGK